MFKINMFAYSSKKNKTCPWQMKGLVHKCSENSSIKMKTPKVEALLQ
jgi:hypothetical protein